MLHRIFSALNLDASQSPSARVTGSLLASGTAAWMTWHDLAKMVVLMVLAGLVNLAIGIAQARAARWIAWAKGESPKPALSTRPPKP